MITQQQALEALDELEGSARGDEPFNHFAAPLLRQYIEQGAQTHKAEVERLADQAEPAPAPSREVRLLTSKDIDDVRKTLWRDAQMNLSDLHAEDAAKAFQCKFCEVNGLTVKEQS